MFRLSLPHGTPVKPFTPAKLERETLDSPFNSSQRRSVKTRLSPFFCVGGEEEEEEIQSIFLHPRGPFWLFPPILLRTDQSPPPLLFLGSPTVLPKYPSRIHTFLKRKVLAAAGIRTFSTLFPRRGGRMSSIEPRKAIQYFFFAEIPSATLGMSVSRYDWHVPKLLEPSVVRLGSVSTRRKSPGGKKDMNCWQQQQRAKVPFQTHPLWRLDEISLSRAVREWVKGTFAASIEEKKRTQEEKAGFRKGILYLLFFGKGMLCESYWGLLRRCSSSSSTEDPQILSQTAHPFPLARAEETILPRPFRVWSSG